MRRACMLVLVSLSCYLLVLLLFTLRRVHRPGELVPMHLNNTSSSTEESREAAGRDGSLLLTQQQALKYSLLLPPSNGTVMRLSSPQHPTSSSLHQQETLKHRSVEPFRNEQQDPGQFHMAARWDSTVGDPPPVRHEDSEPLLSSHDRSNSDIAPHPHVTTLAAGGVNPHSVTHHQTKVQGPSTVQGTVEGRFSIHPEFRFPHPRAVRSLSEILQSDWLKKLKAALHTMSTTQERSVNTVLVTPEALLSQEALVMGTFNQVMMTRLAVLRLLNHWGLDVAFYDTDAILLKDPQPVFNHHRSSGIVGVVGKFPAVLYREWRVALCTAVMLVRSSTATELFWQATSRVQPGSFSDQERMNYGLRALHIQWLGGGGEGKEARGTCQNNMSVTLLPYSFACRSNCKRSERGSYYVWHKGGPRDRESKMKNAELGGMWFLRSAWNSACRGMGTEWLKCIANPFSFT